jgi:hypothetical protein
MNLKIMFKFGNFIDNFKKYFLDYNILDVDDLDMFSKTLQKIKRNLKNIDINVQTKFLPVLNDIIEFNDDLLMNKIIDNI